MTEELEPNLLLVDVQPDEGVAPCDRRQGARQIGACGSEPCTWKTSLTVAWLLNEICPRPTKRLLLDAMLVDENVVFICSDEVDEQRSAGRPDRRRLGARLVGFFPLRMLQGRRALRDPKS